MKTIRFEFTQPVDDAANQAILERLVAGASIPNVEFKQWGALSEGGFRGLVLLGDGDGVVLESARLSSLLRRLDVGYRLHEDAPSWTLVTRCDPKSIMLFTRQFATMLRAGIPLLWALNSLCHTSDDPRLVRVLELVDRRIAEGATLPQAMQIFPRVFTGMYISMVQIGESSGRLEHTMERLGLWLERDYHLSKRIGSALVYPAFVLCLTVLLTLFLFYSVMPGFVSIFDDLHVPLPLITRVIIGITTGIRNPGMWLVAIGVIAGALLIFHDWLLIESNQRRFTLLLMALPVFGRAAQNASLARYCCALETLLGTGVELSTSVRLAGVASGNPVFVADAEECVRLLNTGECQLLSDCMERRTFLYTASLPKMVRAGEESSELPAIFQRLARYYEGEVDYQVEALNATLEPMLLMLVAGVVITIILSIFIPLYAYIGNLGA